MARRGPVGYLWSVPGRSGYRWVGFAAVILLLFGVTNLVEGLAALGNPRFFVSHPRVVGDLTPWGFVTHQYVPASLVARGWMGVIAGSAAVAVGVGVLCKNQLSRWIGVALLGLEAFGQLPRMRGDRLVSASIFTLGIIALSALYRVREANPPATYHGSVLPRLGRCRGSLRLDAARTIAAPRLGNQPTSMVSRARRKNPEHGLLGGAPSGT